MINDVRGKRFKRYKYGVSIWEDRIKDVTYSLELIVKPKKELRYTDIGEFMRQLRESHKLGFKVVPRVIGENSLRSYELSEIIILND